MSVEIKYKGNTIASANTDTTKTIKTSGKYCEADIEVINTQDGGITPSGSLSITENGTYDVTQYAEAVVNVSGGGGSLPTSISKLDGGSFTPASDTDSRNYSILHNLGEKPKGFVIWSDDIVYGTAETTIMVANLLYKVCDYSATAVGSYLLTRKTTSGAFGQYSNTVAATAENSWLSVSDIKIGISSTYKAGITYNWLAWA